MYTICNRNYLPYITARFQNGHLSIFLGQNFWKTGGLKKKREAVRSPKSREVFNSRRENHMYELLSLKLQFLLRKQNTGIAQHCCNNVNEKT